MNSIDIENLKYEFSLDEIQVLLKFLRNNQELREDLPKLVHGLEKYVYSIMSIDEAEEFFK